MEPDTKQAEATISDTEDDQRSQYMPATGQLNNVAAQSEPTNDNESPVRRSSRTRQPNVKSPSTPTVPSSDSAAELSSTAKDGHKRKAHVQDVAEPSSKRASKDKTSTAANGKDDGEEDSDSETVYCICRGPDDGSFMICCDGCLEW